MMCTFKYHTWFWWEPWVFEWCTWALWDHNILLIYCISTFVTMFHNISHVLKITFNLFFKAIYYLEWLFLKLLTFKLYGLTLITLSLMTSPRRREYVKERIIKNSKKLMFEMETKFIIIFFWTKQQHSIF